MAFAAVALVVATAWPGVAYPRPGRTERMSLGIDGAQGGSVSQGVDISADGRIVAFHTSSPGLVPGDTNSFSDVFVRDRRTGVIELVSVASDGTQANVDSFSPALSADGRYVAFTTLSNNLVPGDDNGAEDVFVRDQQTGITERVSVASDGTQGDLGSWAAALSADGRVVAFSSAASTLTPGDTNGRDDVFVHDREAGTTERVALVAEGAVGSQFPDISADGRYVVFQSVAANFGGIASRTDVFVHDRVTGTIEMVSVPAYGGQANVPTWSSQSASISAAGRFVAFTSGAPNLVPGDANPGWDVFVRDRLTGSTERVSVSSDGSEGNGESTNPSISADGRYVAFASSAANLVAGDANGALDVFVHDRLTGSTERVSVASDGTEGNTYSHSGKLSGDGGRVALVSAAANLVPGDTNGQPDVFVHDRGDALGVAGLQVAASPGGAVAEGWATFSGAVTSVSDPPDDGGSGADELGAELTGASVVYRPEGGDILARWSVSDLPPIAAGIPGTLYGIELRIGAQRYEIRALRAGVAAAPPGAPHFALYECETVCLEVARLSGGFGTTGTQVQASVPLSSLGTAEGGVLTSIRAFTGLGEAGAGAVRELDEVLLPAIELPRRVVSLGIVPAGTAKEEVEFDTPAVLSDGLFSGQLAVASLPPGEYEVWANACLGDACGADSVTVRIA